MTRDLPLDGLRAVSVLFVLLSHAVAWHHLPALARLGGLGVGIFFVISGYIITRVFALDLRMELAHPIRVFYIKRCFRILPVLLALSEVLVRQWLQRHARLAAWLSPLPLILLAGWFEIPYIETAGAFEAGCFLSVPLLSMMVVLLRDRGAMARVLACHGRISFSLYVLQQLFLASDGAVPILENISVGSRVLLAILAAELSFRWIEQPSLRWRQSLLGKAYGSPIALPESRT